MLTLESVCEGARQLPCSPSLLPAVVKILENPDSQLEDLERVILRDTGLTAAVLRLVNSVSFNSGRSFDGIGDAVLRLGFRETYRLVVSILGGKFNALDTSGFGWSPGDFCRHSFTVAVATRRVALMQQQISSDLAYTAGLMHDVGKLVLAYFCSAHLEEVRRHQAENQCYWIDSERAVLGFTHCEVSARLLQDWSFPANLIAVSRFYDEPDHAPAEFTALVNLVHIGKHLAIQTGIGGGEDAFWVRLNTASLGPLGLSERDLQAVMPDLLDELNRLLGSRLVGGKIDF